MNDLTQKLKAFTDSFHCMIGAVNGSQINEFISSLKVEGRTKNNCRQAISVLFEFAKKQKYIPVDYNVMDEVESVAEADFEIEIFNPDGIVKLLNHA